MRSVAGDLEAIAKRCTRAAATEERLRPTFERVNKAIEEVGRSWSGSWIGYHARVYYDGFQIPTGTMWDAEWGRERQQPGWMITDDAAVDDRVYNVARLSRDKTNKQLRDAVRRAAVVFEEAKEELLVTLDAYLADRDDARIKAIRDEAENVAPCMTASESMNLQRPTTLWSRDSMAVQQGIAYPRHLQLQALLVEKLTHFTQLRELGKLARRAATYMEKRLKMGVKDDAALLLRLLGELEQQREEGNGPEQMYDVPELAENLGWKPTRINKAIEILENRALIETHSGLGSGDYVTHAIVPTSEGLLAMEDARDEAAASEQVPAKKTSGRGDVSATPIKIFISHSSRDKQVAEALADLMRNALSVSTTAIRCTSVTAYALAYGAKSTEQLRAEVVGAPVVLGIITEASVESAFVLFELGARWGVDKYLVALLAGAASYDLLPSPIGHTHAAKCDRDALIKLVEEVADHLGVQRPRHADYSKHVDALVAASTAAKPPAATAAAAAPAAVAKRAYGLSDQLLLFRESVKRRMGVEPLMLNVAEETASGEAWGGVEDFKLKAELDAMHAGGAIQIESKGDVIYVVRAPMPAPVPFRRG